MRILCTNASANACAPTPGEQVRTALSFRNATRDATGLAGTNDAVAMDMLDSNNAKELILEHMPVVCSENGQFATVDHIEGRDSIKLEKDDHGQHHYIPLTWVTSVDDKVHIDRPGSQAMREWSTTPPPNS